MPEVLNELNIILHLDAGTFSLPAAKATAARLLDAIAKARPGEGIKISDERADPPWSVDLSLKDATSLCETLCNVIPKAEAAGEEWRRAAGYGPRSEETHVVRDEKGEIVSMTKRLEY